MPLRQNHRLRCPPLCYAFANMDAKNKLYFGNNLNILREYLPDARVDLIYLAPPFNSSASCTFGVAPPFRVACVRQLAD